MQTQNRIFDDLARLGGGALSTLAGLKQEIEALVRDRFDRLMADGGYVRREEFDVVRAMAQEARAEQERMRAQLEALERKLADRAP